MRLVLLALMLVCGRLEGAAAPLTSPAAPAPEAETEETATQPESPPDPFEGLSARSRYNLGVARLTEGDAEVAADAFLAARDGAGPDPELRYRAAFNLGMALAAQADAEADDPAAAIETLRQSAAWFNDAVRLMDQEGEDDARVNLEIVLRRIQQLADQLNEGDGLENRLARIIDDQRSVRDEVRRLLTEIQAEGEGTEPVGYQRRFEALAARERVLQAEAAVIGDLAAEERQHIENLGEEALTDEQRLRAYQLQAMGRFLERARQSLSDSRRRLRRLEGERGHRSTDRALAELKRAREQLDDPLAVLKAVTRDQLSVLEHTAALSLIGSGRIALEADPDKAVEAPTWLTAEHLAERQEDAAVRTDEVRQHLVAGTEGEPDEAADPQAARVREAATEAIPLLEEAAAAMASALSSLPDKRWTAAAEQQGRALDALNRAMERFAGLRDLIELTYADQARIVAALTPPEDDTASPDPDQMTAWARRAVADSAERMARLEPLLREELLAPAPPGEDEAAGDQAEQQYQLAESLRARVVAALGQLDAALGTSNSDARARAEAALDAVEALRRLFYSVVEHLQELLVEQTRTHDDTASIVDATIEELPARLGLIDERQAQHAMVGDAIAEALAEQADAAAEEQGAGSQAQDAGVDMAKVVAEIRSAGTLMHSASAAVADAAASAHAMSPAVEPVLEDQQGAIEHIETALALLQAPRDDEQRSGDRDQQDAQQPAQQQSGQQEQEEMSQRQALRRLQAIRDREAERQRSREGEAMRDPVEKDW